MINHFALKVLIHRYLRIETQHKINGHISNVKIDSADI